MEYQRLNQTASNPAAQEDVLPIRENRLEDNVCSVLPGILHPCDYSLPTKAIRIEANG